MTLFFRFLLVKWLFTMVVTGLRNKNLVLLAAVKVRSCYLFLCYSFSMQVMEVCIFK